jgi:3-deoxy-D-manno-octulosonic-acid transferase
MFFLYSLLYCIALFFLFPVHYLKRPKQLRKRWLREKFGFIDSRFNLSKSPPPPFAKEGQGGIIWVHAVSVGEVMASLPLLKRLREKYPSKSIILSTITDTGQKVGREGAPEGTSIVYLPFDIPFVLKSVLRHVKPELLITIETELWPNIFKVFKEHGIPIMLLNGRISGNSLKGYKKISFFMRRVLSCVDLFCMQSELDAERIRSIGADRGRVKVLGNFKFDMEPPSAIPEWAKRISGPVLIAGSTHEGEEDFIISMYCELKNDFSGLNLIIAPRHPERSKEVEDLLRSKGLSFISRSALDADSKLFQTFNGTIILLDTVGELSTIYGIADIAIIGKSFKGYGGQNPLEPAYWGKPIVCGPHMENFPFVRDFYVQGAALEVKEEGLYPVLKELLLSPEKAKKMGEKAKKVYMKNTGSVSRAMEIIAKYVS